VIDKENGNYGSCVNRGLKEARGKYIKLLDSDDSYINKAFEDFVNFLSTYDADLFINDYCIVDKNGIIMETYSFKMPINQAFSVCEMPSSVARWLWHHGMTYKTQILRDMNYHQTEGISYTDDEWIFKPMKNIKSVRYFPHNLYLYLIGREGQTFDPRVVKKSLKNMMIVIRSMIDFYSQSEGKNDNYMYLKLRSRVIGLYGMHNFYFSKDFNVDMVNLDKYIKDANPRLWNDLDDVKGRFKCRFIHRWRQSGYKRCLFQVFEEKLRLFVNKLRGRKTGYHMPDELKRW
jgi:glycosyltransferase involved in cell wall biosynthesis